MGAVVIEEIRLDICLARTRQKFEFALPRIRIVAIDVGARSNMALPHRLE